MSKVTWQDRIITNSLLLSSMTFTKTNLFARRNSKKEREAKLNKKLKGGFFV
jgi:hypothetical protein